MNVFKPFKGYIPAEYCYLVIQRPVGGSADNGREWELSKSFFDLDDAHAFAKNLIKELEGTEMLITVAVLDVSLGSHGDADHPINFFAEEGNGKMPAFVIEALKSVRKEALLVSRRLSELANEVDVEALEKKSSGNHKSSMPLEDFLGI